MQFQADVLGVPVIRPQVIETTALGAAYAAGLAVGAWEGADDMRTNWVEGKRWVPEMEGKQGLAVQPLAAGRDTHLRLGADRSLGRAAPSGVTKRSPPGDECYETVGSEAPNRSSS
jgi:hypothetical protein